MRPPAPAPPEPSPPDPRPPEAQASATRPTVPWAERLERDPAFVSRQIAGETILVPIRQNMGDLESVYSLNEVGTHVWDRLDGTHTLGEILDSLVAEFEVARDEAERDLLDFLIQLRAIRAVRPAVSPAGEGQP